MKKISDIDEWVFTKNISVDKRQADVSIHLKYPDTKALIKYSPAQRRVRIKEDLKKNFRTLLDTQLFENYILIGTVANPAGIRTKIAYSLLKKIAKMDVG